MGLHVILPIERRIFDDNPHGAIDEAKNQPKDHGTKATISVSDRSPGDGYRYIKMALYGSVWFSTSVFHSVCNTDLYLVTEYRG